MLELVAAGNPRVMAAESWRFLVRLRRAEYAADTQPGSFRTATYVCRGTVFNPHIELDMGKRAQPDERARPSYDEKSMLIARHPESVEESRREGWFALCCL